VPFDVGEHPGKRVTDSGSRVAMTCKEHSIVAAVRETCRHDGPNRHRSALASVRLSVHAALLRTKQYAGPSQF